MNEVPLRTLSEQVDPKVAALLVIDMQNDFCHPQVSRVNVAGN
jgi:isochorismate hydrolase